MNSTYFDTLSKDYLNYYLNNYHSPKQVSTICDLSNHTSRICNLPELKLYKKLIIEKLKKPVLDESAISNKELYMKYTKGGQVWSCGDESSEYLDRGFDRPLEPTVIEYFYSSNIKIVNMSPGYSHSLFLDNIGLVYSSGIGHNGQLGHNDRLDKLKPTPIKYFTIYDIKIVNVVAGISHSLFLDNLGRVYSCGTGRHGQLGHGDNDYRLKPRIIRYFTKQSIKIVNITAAYKHSLFLDSNGRVYSCGVARHGQLGHGDDTSNKLEPTLISYFAKQSIKIINITNVYNHSLFLDDLGRVYSCGRGEHGQLGHRDDVDKLEPTLIEYFSIHDIKILNMASGRFHSLFLDDIGRVYNCGFGQYGQLGHGDDKPNKLEPTVIKYFTIHDIKIVNVVAGTFHSLFLDNVGRVYSCGDGYSGQLGHGNRINISQPKYIENLPMVIDIKSGGNHSLFLV